MFYHVSHKYFISVDVTLFKTTYFSDHGLWFENDLFQSKFVHFPVVIDISLSKTYKLSQVYERKRLATNIEVDQILSLPPLNSSMDDPILSPIFVLSILNESNLPNALRKCKRSWTHYPLTHYVAFDNLSSTFQCSTHALSSISIPSLITKL